MWGKSPKTPTKSRKNANQKLLQFWQEQNQKGNLLSRSYINAIFNYHKLHFSWKIKNAEKKEDADFVVTCQVVCMFIAYLLSFCNPFNTNLLSSNCCIMRMSCLERYCRQSDDTIFFWSFGSFNACFIFHIEFVHCLNVSACTISYLSAALT